MVFLRFVNHSQPLTRLHRLLDLKYFDDALSFAITYNLSVDVLIQKIFLTLIYSHFSWYMKLLFVSAKKKFKMLKMETTKKLLLLK